MSIAVSRLWTYFDTSRITGQRFVRIVVVNPNRMIILKYQIPSLSSIITYERATLHNSRFPKIEFFRSIMRLYPFCFPNTLHFFPLLSNDERTLLERSVRTFPLFRSYDGEITSDDRDCCHVKSTFLTILLLFRNVYGVSFEKGVDSTNLHRRVPCLETQR